MINRDVGSISKIKKGAIFSFLAILFEIVVNFFLLRYLTKGLGSDYGLYTLALNTISIFLVDFGLGQSVTKFISKYRLNDDKEGENNFLGIVLKIYLLLDSIVLVACLAIFFCIPFIYKGLSLTEISSFKVVFVIVSIYSCISFPMLPLNGILQGHEEFSTIKILSMIQKGLCTALLVGCLLLKAGLYSAVLANVITSLLMNVIQAVLVFKKCHIKPNIKYRDKRLLKSILNFTVWIAVSAIASRLSLSIMPTILATVQSSSVVAVFGIAVTLETYAYLFSTAISGLFLPKITKDVESGDFDLLNKTSISIGKFQMFISCLILVGFISFGKEFLRLYLEPIYMDAYFPTVCLLVCVVLMSSLLIPQTMSFAMGTIKYAAIIELIVSAIRLSLCWLFAKYFGLLGLTLCFLVFETILNICKLIFVYYKKQRLNMGKFCFQVYFRSLIPMAVSLLAGFLVKKGFYANNWITFIFCCVALSAAFLLVSLAFYFDKNEMEFFKDKIIKKIPFCGSLNKIFDRAEKNNHYVPTVFCIFLLGLSMFTSDYPITKVALGALLAFFAICLFFYFYNCLSIKLQKGSWVKKKIFIRNSSFWFIFLFTVLFAITFFVTKSFESVFGILKYLIILWSAFLFVEIFSFKTFFKCFKNVFFLVCCFSLFMTLLIAIKGENFSIDISGGYYNYYFLFFSMTKADLVGRNCAMFWEPGIFASFCCIAIAGEILFDKDKWYKQLPYYFVFVVSLISSGSLAGYVLALILILLFLGKFKTKYVDVISWILLFGIIAGFILFTPLYQFYLKIIPSLQTKGLSLTTRYYCFFVDFEIFKTSPIFGVGSRYGEMFSSISNSLYPGLLDTSLNTFGYYLGAFGIAGILFFAVFVYSIFFCKTLQLKDKIISFLLGFLILSKEPHTLSLFSMIVLFYFMKDSNIFDVIKINKRKERLANDDGIVE